MNEYEKNLLKNVEIMNDHFQEKYPKEENYVMDFGMKVTKLVTLSLLFLSYLAGGIGYFYHSDLSHFVTIVILYFVSFRTFALFGLSFIKFNRREVTMSNMVTGLFPVLSLTHTSYVLSQFVAISVSLLLSAYLIDDMIVFSVITFVLAVTAALLQTSIKETRIVRKNWKEIVDRNK